MLGRVVRVLPSLKCLNRALAGENACIVANEEHGDWYREKFAPSVTAGLISASDLAGYRTGQVYLRGSMHVPLNCDAVRGAMPVFFELLSKKAEPAVRVVLAR